MKIQTEVLEMFHDFITPEKFKEEVEAKVNYFLEETKDRYYTYNSMMMWVAEQTLSVVHCDESKHEYSFSFVGL